ncbi:LysM domain-containing protein [Pelagibacterium luteolum]|uniref:LysM domain-containing protein n=1 Tax=Pelagibacterium luteolum TaxID=440168 RepID=A0A1G7TIT4_9HYPH|nr:LysM domain-containing protein [Pelagibacterium luteolum]SDG34934.1 LysM domain-containing protein [Pelagibacterium luteolum]
MNYFAPEYSAPRRKRPAGWHLNRDLSLADINMIVLEAMRGDPCWKIAARYKTNERRIKDICWIEGVSVSE